MKPEKLPVVKAGWPWKAAFKMIKDPVSFLKTQQKKTGDLYRIDAPIPFVVLSNHEHIRHILQVNWRNYEKGPAYRGFALMLGNGILNSEGDEWKRNRKMIQPGFNRDHVAGLTETMLEVSNEWADLLQQKSLLEKPIEAKTEMIQFSLDIIARVLMGQKLAEKYKARFLPLLQKQYGFVMQHNRSFIRIPKWIPTPSNRLFHQTRKDLHDLVNDILDASSELTESTMVTMLLQATDEQGQKMSREQLRDEFLTLFVTGFETTGNALAWALLLLARHPEIQQKIALEADEISQNGATASSLMRSPWLNATIKETLRLYPSVWIIARRSLGKDVIDGKEIPAKAHIFISNFLAHRDPKFWENPEEFDPERFIKNPDNPSYLPFGLGARMCIGNHFSHMEMLAALYQFCKRFHIELAQERDFAIDPKITLQPLGDIWLRLVNRG